MCGIAGLFGPGWSPAQLDAMVAAQRHRGPDAHGVHHDPAGEALLGHNRLSILDLSDAGRQPMTSADGRHWIAFNGEVYNYLELRAELAGYPFRTRTDTEVILAAWQRWGAAALDRFVGMFAFLLWDAHARTLVAVRDRFGVKPLCYHAAADGRLAVASELAPLFAAGVPQAPDVGTWATYLATGAQDQGERTFWAGVRTLPPGHLLRWDAHRGARVTCWYDLADRAGPELDPRPQADVEAEYVALMDESVRWRFRSDVPVGVNVSGGVDSSALLALVGRLERARLVDAGAVTAFTFVTGDPRYDELPWVEALLAHTRHPHVACRLAPGDVPALAASVWAHTLEPFGGIPTLAYARLFEEARARGVVVLLDGQGMDEQWAGYDYYAAAARSGAGRRLGHASGELLGESLGASLGASLVQGTTESPVRPGCLTPEFRALAEPSDVPRPFGDALRDMQYRDARHAKLPRALRYNDRVSMRASTELREPFLDHRLFELALRQPADRKVRGGVGKWTLRRLVRELAPAQVAEAPKRAVQTPQREWLRGALRDWADAQIERALAGVGGAWLDEAAVRAEWARYAAGAGDNSVFVWQWATLPFACLD